MQTNCTIFFFYHLLGIYNMDVSQFMLPFPVGNMYIFDIFFLVRIIGLLFSSLPHALPQGQLFSDLMGPTILPFGHDV